MKFDWVISRWVFPYKRELTRRFLDDIVSKKELVTNLKETRKILLEGSVWDDCKNKVSDELTKKMEVFFQIHNFEDLQIEEL